MPSVYNPDNFQGRVNLAAQYMLRGSRTTRHFDTCFEMWDGDIVATALWRRAQRNFRLMERLPKYLSVESVSATAAEYAHIPTRSLKHEAARIRAEMQAASDKRSAEA